METRKFICARCGAVVEVCADHFVPGISGTLFSNDGTQHIFEDPTVERMCVACYSKLAESVMAALAELCRREVEEDDNSDA